VATLTAIAAPLPVAAVEPTEAGAAALLAIWLIGSATVLLASLRRIRRFGRLLRDSSRAATPELEELAAAVARELGLPSSPPLVLTHARISPMTWWTRGRIRLVLPLALLERADPLELRWVLAHELAHIRRRDHFVRWIEWLATVAMWWNPVVWWARRNLRLAEEDACDALVLRRMPGAPRTYARTLLRVVEILAGPMGPTPAVATGIDAARSLEHRLSMIVARRASRTAPAPLVAGLSVVVVTSMALGLGSPPSEPASAVAARDAATAGDDAAGAAPAGAPGAAPPRYAAVSATLSEDAASAMNTYLGTAGPDSYQGSRANETISGFGGADTLAGGPGRDAIAGGDGNDALSGGAGADEIRGGAGADEIRGGAGRDEIHGGAGNDLVRAWADGTPDRIDCGVGVDRAVVDPTDSTRRCEIVVVRDPS
jgi:beta-lactamase regulating signal transducer with metallopeptidase domain